MRPERVLSALFIKKQGRSNYKLRCTWPDRSGWFWM